MDLKKLLRESLLNEGKPFGKNSYKNRFEPTDDIKNKMHLLGVYRQQLGISNVNDIKTVDEVDRYYNKFIKNYSELLYKKDIPKKRSKDGKDDKDYYNRPDLAKKHVKLYADNFLKFYDARIQPITTKDYPKFENTFLNKFNFDENIKNRIIEELDYKVTSIENPEEGDVLLDNDDLTIVIGSSKSKCIRYGRGEKWCISQADANMYNTYRTNYKATMYFVLDKTTKDKLDKEKDTDKRQKIIDEEKLVIMVYPDGYAIADKTNRGKRTGSKDGAKSWDKIVEELPILKGHQDKFEQVEVSDSEIKYERIVSKNYYGDDLQDYINGHIKGLKVNGSEVSDREFVVDYISSGEIFSPKELSPKQFESLDKRPKGPREGVIEAGFFNYKNYDDYGLTPTEITRIIKIKIKSGDELTPKEFASLDDSTRSELIDNGYFMYEDLSKYKLTYEEIRRIIKFKLKNKSSIYPEEFYLLDDSDRIRIIDSGYFNHREYEDYRLTNEEIIRLVKIKVKKRIHIIAKEFESLDDSTRSEVIDSGYFNKKVSSGYNLTDEEIRKVEARREQPVNESINLMKRMNLL